MKKIGHQTLLLATGKDNPRNGEGCFIRRKDGSILLVYIRYTGEDWGDECPADLAGCLSYDEGETWSEPQILIAHKETVRNLMCPCLLRMKNGDIGMVYLEKGWNGYGRILFARSQDEGMTWGAPVEISNANQYYVIENARLIRLESGRLLLPANLHSIHRGDEVKMLGRGKMCFFASDDEGASWHMCAGYIDLPLGESSRTGLQETVVLQRKDGSLFALSRTDRGCQYECFSYDEGDNWTVPAPNMNYTSPASPAMIYRGEQETVTVFNPIPNYVGRENKITWGRTPLVMTVSDDEGASHRSIFYLEDDPENAYCYPAVFEGEDYYLVTYYHSNNTGIVLNATKVTKVMKAELV